MCDHNQEQKYVYSLPSLFVFDQDFFQIRLCWNASFRNGIDNRGSIPQLHVGFVVLTEILR